MQLIVRGRSRNVEAGMEKRSKSATASRVSVMV
jgi:hypothetical protein